MLAWTYEIEWPDLDAVVDVVKEVCTMRALCYAAYEVGPPSNLKVMESTRYADRHLNSIVRLQYLREYVQRCDGAGPHLDRRYYR